jgi:hypothetical protein
LIGETDDSSGWNANDRTGTSLAPLDPLLGPLQGNGGPTPTHAVLAGSPAIETGDPSLFGSVDQRGTFRFHSGANAPVDIGAFDAGVERGFRLTAPAGVVAGAPFALTVEVLDYALLGIVRPVTINDSVGSVQVNVTDQPDTVTHPNALLSLGSLTGLLSAYDRGSSSAVLPVFGGYRDMVCPH